MTEAVLFATLTVIPGKREGYDEPYRKDDGDETKNAVRDPPRLCKALKDLVDSPGTSRIRQGPLHDLSTSESVDEWMHPGLHLKMDIKIRTLTDTGKRISRRSRPLDG